MSNQQIYFFLAILFLVYPLLTIPSLLSSKRERGKYFVSNKILIAKYKGNGNSFNMHNIYSFFGSLLIGFILLLVYFFSSFSR